MKKITFFLIAALSLLSHYVSARDVVGFWKSIDDKTHKPQSIIAIYKNQDKVFGRIIATYDEKTDKIIETTDNPKTRAPGVKGDPYYVGLDIIWDVSKAGTKYTNGQVMDPEKGRVYGVELWTEGNDKLIVRGKLLGFGRNQTWELAKDTDFPKGYKKPDLSKLTPKVLPVKG